jgi:hypothetical protein
MFIRVTVPPMLVAVVLLEACYPWPRQLPPRPANVSADAVRIEGGKTQWWITCRYKAEADVCKVFNAGGVVIVDEVFRPYDGGPPVLEQDLRIDERRSHIDVLYLQNGRILLATTRFDYWKPLIDKMRSENRHRTW